MAVIVTSCSKRKRFRPASGLCASELMKGELGAVSSEWMRRVRAAKPEVEASRLYCGRQFSESLAVGAHLRAKILVVSAGLGVVTVDDRVAPYSLTIASGAPDNILSRVDGEAGPGDWWQALVGLSQHQAGLAAALSQTFDNDIVLLAMPSSYLAMVEHEFCDLPEGMLARMRIFTAPSFRFREQRLNSLVMPYDARLDGPSSPMPGTATDFSARAMRHFSTCIFLDKPDGSAREHAAAVSHRLAKWVTVERPIRTRQSDDALKDVMRAHWGIAGGSAAQMLRWIRRDLGLACEQGRMRHLYSLVREEMEQAS